MAEALPLRPRLEELEATIERGLTTFVEVGNAIREIRDSRLYRETHKTFEAYCRERWGWSRQRANQQIEAANTAELVGDGLTTTVVKNERQARALAPLAKEDPEAARSLWSGLTAAHGDELTAKHVEKAQKEVREARAMRMQLPEKTRAVVEESDPEDHSLSRNPAQLRHLMDIANRHGDEEAARVALTVADGEHRSTFDAYPEHKADRMGVHYTSDTGEWYTPPRVVGKVVSVLGEIDLDPCADPDKEIPAKAHLTKHEDGLVYEWNGRVYMNPPYGKEIAPWVEKLKRHHEAGDVPAAIALLPARTDTAWFALLDAYPRCFIRGRLKFSGGKNSAPFPSAAVYMGPPEGKAAFLSAFADLGTVFERTVV